MAGPGCHMCVSHKRINLPELELFWCEWFLMRSFWAFCSLCLILADLAVGSAVFVLHVGFIGVHDIVTSRHNNRQTGTVFFLLVQLLWLFSSNVTTIAWNNSCAASGVFVSDYRKSGQCRSGLMSNQLGSREGISFQYRSFFLESHCNVCTSLISAFIALSCTFHPSSLGFLPPCWCIPVLSPQTWLSMSGMLGMMWLR